MTIEVLLAVRPRHCTSTAGSVVERAPQSFYNLTINHPGTADERWCIPRMAFLYMAMDMEQANTWFDNNIFGERKKLGVLQKSYPEVDKELACNIIQQEDEQKTGITLDCMNNRVIHVPLTNVDK